MLDWTDRHCRYFLRQLSRHTLLYTEMVTTGAIIHGKGDYLAYSEEEHPVALQLGGRIETTSRIALMQSATRCAFPIRHAPNIPFCTRSDGQPTLRLISS